MIPIVREAIRTAKSDRNDDPLAGFAAPRFDGAACATVDPEIFFPDPGGSVTGPRLVCEGCPARNPCLEWALEHREDGVWGGTTRHERQAMRAKRNRAARKKRAA